MRNRSKPGFDWVSAEARARVDGWSEKSRELFAELLEDARTDLQRELLNRAVAAGHTAAELHAFADALRGLSDREAFEKCTVERTSAPDYSVVQLLKAEADPLFAFTLKGGELSPAEDGPRLPDGKPAYALPGAMGRERPGFAPTLGRPGAAPGLVLDADGDARTRKTDRMPRELGHSPGAELPLAPVPSAPGPRGGSAGSIAQDLLNEALHALGVTFREQAVDGPGQPSLEQALPQAATALAQGLPVAAALGPSAGKDRRLALFLQVQTSGKSRAYQLFDVLSQEVAWVNEGDLLARVELPFSSKQNRRITRLVIPSGKP